jgi:hypothetical protein
MQNIGFLLIGAVCLAAVLFVLDRWVSEQRRLLFRYAAAILSVSLFFYALQKRVTDHSMAVDITKGAIALIATACVFYEAHRAGLRKPVSERWAKFIGVTLGVAAVVTYFNGFYTAYPKFYHRHEHFHYYVGAKYFRELGYDGLYMCAAIAQDELGVVTHTDETTGRTMRIDMKKEVRHPDRKLRNLGGDNLLIPAGDVLDKPELCKPKFSEERWAQFKDDIKFFRLSSDRGYWEGMQKDHGYNPPPVWTIMGHYLSEIFPPGKVIAGLYWVQWLAAVDIGYLLGMFAALWWAFGWRVAAVGAIFWGCQSSAPFLWTGGAFLRQDWLFFFVLSTCLIRKRYYALGGAALVYSALLRIFPGLVVIGWVTVAIAYIVRNKRIAMPHLKTALGCVLALAVLVPLSLHVAGKDAYQQFYQHTIVVHDKTPLTNHMGLRVLISHKPLPGPSSGRMKYTQDSKLRDPFEVWKNLREARYAKYRYVAYGVIALSLAFFVYVVRRVRSLWIAQCLGQIWIILLSQLTCYYYAFMIIAAPLTKVKRSIEAPLFGLALLSQFVWRTFGYNDDKYTALTAISLLFCYGLICAFAPKGFLTRLSLSQTQKSE